MSYKEAEGKGRDNILLRICSRWPIGATVVGQTPNRIFLDDCVAIGSLFRRINNELQRALPAMADGGHGVRIHTVSWGSLRGNPG